MESGVMGQVRRGPKSGGRERKHLEGDLEEEVGRMRNALL